MRDPHPRNISGEKVVQHSVKHEVNWGHVAVAVAVLASLYAGYQFMKDDEEEGEGVSIDPDDARDLVSQ